MTPLYADEVFRVESPETLRMGLVTGQQSNQRAGTFSPIPHLRKGGGGVEIDLYKQC